MAGKSGKSLDEILSGLVKGYKDSGYLGDYFDEVKALQDEENPKFVSETIKSFNDTMDGYIAEIKKILKEPEVDYKQLKYFADCVNESNLCSLGGSLVHNSSLKLVAAGDAKNKAECLKSLEELNRDLETLKDKLKTITRIEDSIYDQKHKKDRLF